MLDISYRISITVGTNKPLDINSWSDAPLGLPLATSSRKRSPLLKCKNPYFLIIRSHCVPFPHPGPPITHIVFIFSDEFNSIRFDFDRSLVLCIRTLQRFLVHLFNPSSTYNFTYLFYWWKSFFNERIFSLSIKKKCENWFIRFHIVACFTICNKLFIRELKG